MKTSFLTWTLALVAMGAVACGDDTATSGAGGGTGSGGGDGTGGDPTTTTTGSPTSATSTATATATATATTTGGGGEGTGGDGTGGNGTGGDGTGGTGTGGESGCIQATLTDVAIDSDTFLSPVIRGVITANFGGAEEDWGFLFFDNTEHTTDLADVDPENLTEGVLIGEDFDPESGFLGSFFASTEGTLDVSDEGWSYTGVTLAETDEEGAILTDGRCIELADVSGDLFAPLGFVCNAGYYDAADGCDCGCGVYDPDCDLADQTVYGCDEGQTCGDPDATCEGDLAACTAATAIEGTTFGGTTINDDLAPITSCSAGTGGTQVFSYTAGDAGEYTFTVTPTLGDVTLGIRQECDQFHTSVSGAVDEDGTVDFCADAGLTMEAESFTVALEADEEIFLVVQAYSDTDEGVFTGTVTEP